MIIDETEKYGTPVSFIETKDFEHHIDTCQLTESGFIGSMYTWCNGRSDVAYFLEDLDRCLGNLAFQSLFSNIEVEHLI